MLINNLTIDQGMTLLWAIDALDVKDIRLRVGSATMSMTDDEAIATLGKMRDRAVKTWGKGSKHVVALDEVTRRIKDKAELDQYQADQERAHNAFLGRNGY